MIEFEMPKDERAVPKKGRVFHSTLTDEYRLLAAVNVVIAFVVIYQGYVNSRIIAARGIPFIVLGVLLLAALGAVTLWTLGRTITITPAGLKYEGKGKEKEIVMSFSQLSELYLPPPNRKIFRSALIGDGRQSFHLDSFSFKEFELIVNIIAVARKRIKDKGIYKV